jgi:hypothetical protein
MRKGEVGPVALALALGVACGGGSANQNGAAAAAPRAHPTRGSGDLAIGVDNSVGQPAVDLLRGAAAGVH